MARVFTAASSHFLEKAGAVVTAVPLTMACWYKPVATNALYVLMMMGDSAASTDYFYLYQNSNNTVVAQAADASAANFAVTSAGTSAGAWTHACAVFSANDARAAYVNGGSKGTGTDARTPNPIGVINTLFGARYSGGTKNLFLNGSLAECGIWNAALDDAEVLALSKGISPLLVRTTSLVAYWPLIGNFSPEIDLRGRNELTVTGAVQGAHSPIFYPQGNVLAAAQAAAARFWLMGPMP